MNKRVIKRW